MSASSTIQTYLMHGSSKLVDIIDYSDIGAAPSLLETTTQSDTARTYIPGIEDVQNGYVFNANYDHTNYAALKALEGEEETYALYFGANASGQADGHLGKFEWKGYLSVILTGAGVNEVRKMQITIIPTTNVSDKTSGS